MSTVKFELPIFSVFFPHFILFSDPLMLAEYSSSIKPEHERAEHVLRLQNPSMSTFKNTWQNVIKSGKYLNSIYYSNIVE